MILDTWPVALRFAKITSPTMVFTSTLAAAQVKSVDELSFRISTRMAAAWARQLWTDSDASEAPLELFFGLVESRYSNPIAQDCC